MNSNGPFRLEDQKLIATTDFIEIERKIYQMYIEAQDSAGHKAPLNFEVWDSFPRYRLISYILNLKGVH